MTRLRRAFARPLMLLYFARYKGDVRNALFPVDPPDREVPGPGPDRLLFVGDVAMAGYGVLHHGMATPYRTAQLVSRQRSRGCRWETLARADLTIAAVARRERLPGVGVDAVVIMLGIPDVLLGTSEAKWVANLRLIVSRIAEEAGPLCPVVFAGIPLMTDFRAIPDPACRLLRLQTLQLNQATRRVVSETPQASYVELPSWRNGQTYVADTFSWKALHKMVARILAPAIVQRLPAGKPVPGHSQSGFR